MILEVFSNLNDSMILYIRRSILHRAKQYIIDSGINGSFPLSMYCHQKHFKRHTVVIFHIFILLFYTKFKIHLSCHSYLQLPKQKVIV